MSQTVLTSEDIQLLAEIGWVGAGTGSTLMRPTEQIFNGLMVLRPQRDFPYIGMASAHLSNRQPEEAARVLEQGLRIMTSGPQAPPDSDLSMVQVFLGMCLLMSRRTAEAVALLNTLQTTSQYEPALRMANGLLGLPTNTPMSTNLETTP